MDACVFLYDKPTCIRAWRYEGQDREDWSLPLVLYKCFDSMSGVGGSSPPKSLQPGRVGRQGEWARARICV